jgi:hypothetical protein
MFRACDGVKFGAWRVCPKCNSASGSELALSEFAAASASSGSNGQARGKMKMSAFEEHKEELEKFEQMFGRERGRLAVSLDRLTNALVLVGQHGVYCTSQRNPTVPTMDLRIINQELVHAKELVQSVMEEMRQAKQKTQS